MSPGRIRNIVWINVKVQRECADHEVTSGKWGSKIHVEGWRFGELNHRQITIAPDRWDLHFVQKLFDIVWRFQHNLIYSCSLQTQPVPAQVQLTSPFDYECVCQWLMCVCVSKSHFSCMKESENFQSFPCLLTICLSHTRRKETNSKDMAKLGL